MQGFANFRIPSILAAPPLSNDAPSTTTPDPAYINHVGDWFLVLTSNSFWKDKSDVRMHYTATGEDYFAYKPARSMSEKLMEGRNTPEAKSPETFLWAGKGLLRLFTVRWEILGAEERMDEAGWLLTFQHKTIFTAPALNISCKNKAGPDDRTLESIKDWVMGLGDEALSKAVMELYPIEHSS